MDYKLTLFCVVMNRAFQSLDGDDLAHIMKRLNTDSAKYPNINLELFEHLLQIYELELDRLESRKHTIHVKHGFN